MKPGILNLNKWSEKTAQVVRQMCHKVEGPCMGVALLFMEIDEQGEKHWRFKIEMAMDPNEPVPDEDRKRLEKALEYIMAGVQKIYDGADEEMDTYCARGDFH
jgi:hypothetical protein